MSSTPALGPQPITSISASPILKQKGMNSREMTGMRQRNGEAVSFDAFCMLTVNTTICLNYEKANEQSSSLTSVKVVTVKSL